jgi:hypothetical protein
VSPPRVLVASLPAVLGLVTAGCGLVAGGDERDVKAALSAYVQAAAQGNGRQACAYLTPALRRRVDRLARSRHAGGCGAQLGTRLRYRLQTLPAAVRSEVMDGIADTGNVDVSVTGDRARATLRVPGDHLTETHATLVRTPDGWRIEHTAVRGPAGGS